MLLIMTEAAPEGNSKWLACLGIVIGVLLGALVIKLFGGGKDHGDDWR